MRPPKLIRHVLDSGIVEYAERYVNHESSLVVDNEKCIDCGFCEKVCPREAIRAIPGLPEKTNLKYEVDQQRCTYCGVCQILCPVDALTVKVNGEPRLIIMETHLMPEVESIVINIGESSIKKFIQGSINVELQGEVALEDLENFASCCPTRAINIVNNNITISSPACIFCTRCTRFADDNRIPIKVTVKRSHIHRKGHEISSLWNDVINRLCGQESKMEAIRGDLSYKVADRVTELVTSLGKDMFLEKKEED